MFRDRLYGIFDREHAGCLPRLLIARAVSGDPSGRECFLLLMQRELVCTHLQVLLAPTAEICVKAAMSLGRNVPRGWDVRLRVKKDSPLIGFDHAPLRRRCRMGESAL